MSGPVRSMTGFASVQRVTEQGDIVISLKSVNHRGLDLHFHLGAELDSLEQVMRAALKRHPRVRMVRFIRLIQPRGNPSRSL